MRRDQRGLVLNLMDVKWMTEFEAALVKSVDGCSETAYSIGYYSHAAAKAIGPDSVELCWHPNTYDRFHQVRIALPRSEFVTCAGSRQYDYNPVIFVRGAWLTNLHLRLHSVFALIDAINVKEALASGSLTRPKLIELRNQIDEIAASNPAVAFVSFADSLLLKTLIWMNASITRCALNMVLPKMKSLDFAIRLP
jgi:hypothetical protein